MLKSRNDSRRFVCITGGHLSPALSVLEKIEERDPKWNVVWIGRMTALRGDSQESEEYRIVTQKGILFLPLVTGRITRGAGMGTFALSVFQIPNGFFRAYQYLVRYRPSLVISFGGYIALPVAIMAYLLGIPVVTHEQTDELGLANRIISFFATRVYISSPGGTRGNSEKFLYTGIPIRRLIYTPPQHPSFFCALGTPIVYVTGGTTGATSLNALVLPLVHEITKSFTLIHQTGRGDYGRVIRVKKSLPAALGNRYLVSAYFSESDVSWIYKHADLIVGRSGASTVAEVAATGAVALFIPLPWSAGDEQEKNAMKLVDGGSAKLLFQHDTTPEILLKEIGHMVSNNKAYREKARVVASFFDRQGAEHIVKDIETMIVPS